MYKPIQALRGIFALMIVAHHMLPMLGINYTADFGNSIVLFFFILSGFHITLTWKDKIMLTGAPKVFVLKRGSRIFPIQWLMTILFICFGMNVESWLAVPFHLTLTQSLVPLWKINFTLNTPSWFLSSIFICYLVTPLLLNFANKHRHLYFVLQVVTVILWTLFVIYLPDSIGRRWLCYINPFARIIDYSVGISLGLLWNEKSHQFACQYRKFIFTIAEICIIALFSMTLFLPWFLSLNNYPIVRYPIVVVLIAVFTMSSGYISEVLSNKLLAYLGALSMSIYLVHPFILHFTLIESMPIWFDIVLSFVLIIVSAHWLTYFFTPYANKVIDKIIGELR